MGEKFSFNVGLKTIYSSGETEPCTIISPKPKDALITTTFLKPLSVSREKATPEAPKSLRTIFCTHTERPMLK